MSDEVVKVESSAIVAASYRAADTPPVLTVWFPDREASVWEYRNVTPAWWAAFLVAPSKGKFFMGVKLRPDEYPCRRVSHRFDLYGVCKDCAVADDSPDAAAPCRSWAAAT